MTILMISPGETGAKEIDIDNSLKSLQEVVDGPIETYPLSKDVVLILNEEGKIKGLERSATIRFANRRYQRIGTEVIVGNVLIAGTDGENFVSLTPNQISFWKNAFARKGVCIHIENKTGTVENCSIWEQIGILGM